MYNDLAKLTSILCDWKSREFSLNSDRGMLGLNMQVELGAVGLDGVSRKLDSDKSFTCK